MTRARIPAPAAASDMANVRIGTPPFRGLRPRNDLERTEHHQPEDREEAPAADEEQELRAARVEQRRELGRRDRNGIGLVRLEVSWPLADGAPGVAEIDGAQGRHHA